VVLVFFWWQVFAISEPFFQKNLEFFFVFFNVKCVLLQNFPTFAKKKFAKKKN
jgi:hypothetical protein